MNALSPDEESDLDLLKSVSHLDLPDGQQLRKAVGEHRFARLVEENWIELMRRDGQSGYVLTENGRNALKCLSFLSRQQNEAPQL